MNTMFTKNKAFTLVELLVVVTIVSILATIAGIYVFQHFEASRDSARVSTLNLLVNNVELYYLDESRYPSPDDAIDVIYSGAVVWSQGTFGGNAIKEVRNLGEDIPVDPKYLNEYSYSITQTSDEYQFASILEEKEEADGLGDASYIKQANASIETAYVLGNYNKIMLQAKVGSDYYYIASPSIIATDLSNTGVLNIITEQKLVYHEFFNLPASYSGFLDLNGGFNFVVNDPIIFSGSTHSLKTEDGLNTFVSKLQYIYARTPTESFDRYISFLRGDGFNKIKNFLTQYFKITFSNAFSCQDLLDQSLALEDGFYDIDPDGTGPLPEQSVYCDIGDDNIAWTRVGLDYLGTPSGTFSTGAHVSTNYYSLYNSVADNAIISLANPGDFAYVLHQTGTATSNYEIHFDDFSIVEAGNEIRMRLWVTDEDGGWIDSLGLNPESGYMFHNRIHYTDGTFSNNGEVEVLETSVVGGKTWRHLEVKHVVRKEPQGFSWYLGLDAEDTRDLYLTEVELHLYKR